MRGIISKPDGFVFDRNDFTDNNIINSINGTGVVQYLYKRFMGILAFFLSIAANGGYIPGKIYYSSDIGEGDTPKWLLEQNAQKEADKKRREEEIRNSREVQDAQTRLKMNALKKWGIDMIKNEFLPKISYLRFIYFFFILLSQKSSQQFFKRYEQINVCFIFR